MGVNVELKAIETNREFEVFKHHMEDYGVSLYLVSPESRNWGSLDGLAKCFLIGRSSWSLDWKKATQIICHKTMKDAFLQNSIIATTAWESSGKFPAIELPTVVVGANVKHRGPSQSTYIDLDDKRAVIGEGVELGMFCTIGDSTVGYDTVLGNHVKIGREVQVMNSCVIESNANIQDHAVIYDHCYLKAGAVVKEKAIVGPHCYLDKYALVGSTCNVGQWCRIGHSVHIPDGLEVVEESLLPNHYQFPFKTLMFGTHIIEWAGPKHVSVNGLVVLLDDHEKYWDDMKSCWGSDEILKDTLKFIRDQYYNKASTK